MSALDLEHLVPTETPRNATEALHPTQRVGARVVVDTCSAMRLEDHKGSDVIYVSEEKIHVANVRRTIEMADGTPHSWLRLEIKMQKSAVGPQRRANAGDTIQVVEYPWTGQWHQFAKLKGTNKKAADQRDDDPARWSDVGDVREAIKRLESLSYDPWETDGSILTAAISEPWLPLELHKPRNVRKGLRQVFGICRDLQALTAQLFRHPKIKNLLKATANNSIKFWYARDKGPSATPMKLYPEVIDDAQSIMMIAIRASLAGPPDTEHLDCASWVGRSATDLVDLIYRDLLNAENRRAATRRKTESTIDFDEGDFASSSQADDRVVLLRRIQGLVNDPDPTIRRKTTRELQKVIDLLNDD